MEQLCIRCKGKGLCGKRCKILDKFMDNSPKVKEHFSGSSPPEIFVGRVDYPNVFCGVLSPNEKGDTAKMSLPEEWVKQNSSIEEILGYRSQMIYARNKTNIKSSKNITNLIQSLAMTAKPTSTEFFLEKKPSQTFTASKLFTIMANPAPLKKAIIEDNLSVPNKVDNLVGDFDAKSLDAVNELYSASIGISHIQKLFSSGLLGIKKNRKMVPTRWSITAVDDIVGKEILNQVKQYPQLSDFELFTEYYNGNHFEILLLPGNFEFEVIEVAFSGSLWSGSKTSFCHDYESFFGRTSYASEVVGAYYADRLATIEYLDKIKRQAKIVVFHEEREEYYAPLGVGIIREAIRRAMTKQPEKFSTLREALDKMKTRVKFEWAEYMNNCKIIKDYGKQKSLWEFN
jgi:DNA repair protein NreA